MFNLIKKYHFSGSLIFAICTLVVLIYSHSRSEYDYFLSGLLNKVTSPIIELAGSSAGLVKGFFIDIDELTSAKKENKILTSQIKDLKEQILQLNQEVQDNTRLKQALNLDDRLPKIKIYAKVIAEVNNDYSNLIIINRGSSDGILKDQAVISYDGAVGRIIKVGDKESVVQLIIDSQSKIPVILQKNHYRSIAQGDGQGGVLLKAIAREQAVTKGDIVLTSEISSVFPGDFTLGTVESVYQKEFSWFQEAKIISAVNFSKLEDVFVLPNPKKEETMKLLDRLDK